MPTCCSQCVNKHGYKRIEALDIKNIKVWKCKTCGHLILIKYVNSATN